MKYIVSGHERSALDSASTFTYQMCPVSFRPGIPLDLEGFERANYPGAESSLNDGLGNIQNLTKANAVVSSGRIESQNDGFQFDCWWGANSFLLTSTSALDSWADFSITMRE